MTLLSLRSIAKRYGAVAALDGVDLSVSAGSRMAIVGPSGCGKTTLLRLIAGFEAPDAGEIVFDDKVIAEASTALPAHRRGIGVVAQDGALFPHLTIAENIGFGISRRESGRDKRISELAFTVGLDAPILKRRPHELSGGQQQRVALARAMARRPRLMLLDEPFSALDTGLRASMRKTVAELLEAQGIATVLVTHDQAEALSFADEVAVMRDGKFSQVGSPQDLYFHPRDAMVAQFLGDAILLPAHVAGGYADCAIGRIAVNASDRRDAVRVMLRPEQIVLEPLSRDQASEAAARKSLLGEVVESAFGGPFCTLLVKLLNVPDTPAAAIGGTRLMLRRSSLDALQAGAVVRITVSGDAHVFPVT